MFGIIAKTARGHLCGGGCHVVTQARERRPLRCDTFSRYPANISYRDSGKVSQTQQREKHQRMSGGYALRVMRKAGPFSPLGKFQSSDA